MTSQQKSVLYGGCLSALLIFILGTGLMRLEVRRFPDEPNTYRVPFDITLRPEPSRFRADTSLPARPEGRTSGSIDLASFSAERDLITIDDPRVWWESDHDNDTADTENDHLFHMAMQGPMKRIIELVSANGGTLEVHDAFRDTGIHNIRSLHKEGRAVDLTCDQFPLERLAKLCWAAGFDWVLYEIKPAHIHCSVKRDHDDSLILEAHMGPNK